MYNSPASCPVPLMSINCSSLSRSLGRLLELDGSRWRLAGGFGCSSGASGRRASSGGRRMWLCLRVPGQCVSHHRRKQGCRYVPLLQQRRQPSDHLRGCCLLVSALVLRPWASPAQHCSAQMLWLRAQAQTRVCALGLRSCLWTVCRRDYPSVGSNEELKLWEAEAKDVWL